MNKRAIGDRGEQLACEYLLTKGYRILERNYQIQGGEIDIAASKNEVLVIVEVRTRYSTSYGDPLESITPRKLRSLVKTTKFYIQKIKWGDRAARVDVVAIDFSGSFTKPKLTHLENILA